MGFTTTFPNGGMFTGLINDGLEMYHEKKPDTTEGCVINGKTCSERYKDALRAGLLEGLGDLAIIKALISTGKACAQLHNSENTAGGIATVVLGTGKVFLEGTQFEPLIDPVIKAINHLNFGKTEYVEHGADDYGTPKSGGSSSGGGGGDYDKDCLGNSRETPDEAPRDRIINRSAEGDRAVHNLLYQQHLQGHVKGGLPSSDGKGSEKISDSYKDHGDGKSGSGSVAGRHGH